MNSSLASDIEVTLFAESSNWLCIEKRVIPHKKFNTEETHYKYLTSTGTAIEFSITREVKDDKTNK